LIEEVVDAGRVGGGGVVVAVPAVLGVELGVLADVPEVEGGLRGRGRLAAVLGGDGRVLPEGSCAMVQGRWG
jgi:hypothetical protein